MKCPISAGVRVAPPKRSSASDAMSWQPPGNAFQCARRGTSSRAPSHGRK
jgi:hypothetical protein